ncbi:MAG: efflux RND transporter periplasmic adaptor subunit [Thermodesulfobacteriota bacterium]
MSKKGIIVIAVVCGIIVGAAGMYFFAGTTGVEQEARAPGEVPPFTEGRKIRYWQAPMDPTYIRDKPGKSPMGMDLIPVYEGDEEETEPGTVKIDPVTVQNIGVRTSTVERMELKKTIRTIGRIDYDEKRVYRLHTKVDGWIEKLYVDFTGEKVKKGDILLEIYSPKLVSAQEEYLLARKSSETMAGVGRESIVDLSRRRLDLWDVPAHQITEIEKTGKVMKTLHIHSPASGIVVEKPVTEGMYVKPGMRLYTIADISKVWAYVDVYEYELPWIRLGQEAEMTLASYPGQTFTGKISFIYPYMEQKTRTNKVRLEFDNPGLDLKPNMYANVNLKSVVSKKAVAVPTEAVILSGERSIVLLSRGDGKFAPREVLLGAEAEGFYEIREGLTGGEAVVTSAQFLIYSESSLKEAIAKMLEEKEGDDREMKEMEGMDHSGMQGMDHSGMEEMDHSDMKDMNHSNMDEMDHSGMGDMNHSGMEGMENGGSENHGGH